MKSSFWFLAFRSRFLLFLLVGAFPAGPTFAQSGAVRDVLATAFDSPFQTDADLEGYRSDTQARVVGRGGVALFRYPGIASITLDGTPIPARRLRKDLLQVDLPAGPHEVQVLRTGPEAPAADLLEEAAVVATPADVQKRAALLQPGDELVVRDGVYTGWKVELDLAGTAEKPIVIRPQTPGGAILRRDSRVVLRGRFAVIKGFRFEHCTTGPALNVLGSHCRVTQCQFAHCGTPVSTFSHIVQVGMGSDRNRVDHCFFTGSKSMSLAQKITAVDGVGLNNRFDHNLFRDIYRYWINGQENIQIGQNQRDPTGRARPRCLVEFNVFDHAWGDGEIVSNKCSGNVIRHNVAAHCRRSSFTLRGGFEVRFEGNVMVNNGDGLRVMGSRHVITNNLILDQPGWGIYLETGSREGTNCTASEGSEVSHNTIVNCAMGAIGAMPVSEERTRLPSRNVFTDNVLGGNAEALAAGNRLLDSVVRRNLFWAGSPARTVPAGQEAIVADPQIRGEGSAIRPAPAGPGAHLGAPPFPPGLPPVPPRPMLDPSVFLGEAISLKAPKQLLDVGKREGKAGEEGLSLKDVALTAEGLLPGDFLLEWEYQPESFRSVASVAFSDYRLSWGGVPSDGKPSGVIELRKSAQLVSDGTDVLLPSQQFRYKGGMGFKADERTSPDAQVWYRFSLLQRGGRMIVLLGDARRRGDLVPVIVWEDRAAGAERGNLKIEQQGAGRWRGLEAHVCEYAGDVPPSPPVQLTATAHGGSRVSLRWEPGRKGQRFDVYRGTEAGFEPAHTNVLARGVAAGFEDFEVVPDNRYIYRVCAVNVFGLASPFVSVEAQTGTGGLAYQVLPVGAARLEAPFVLEEHPGEPLLAWAPPSTEGDPSPQSGAEFRFAVERTGDYAIWGLVRAPDGSHDSFFQKLDNGPSVVWYTGVHPAFEWSKINSRIRLEKGEHTLRIQHREPGTALAAVLVTDDLAFGP